MASPVGRSPVRRPAAPVAPAPGGTLRAQPVARPAVPAATRIGALSAEQVIAEIVRYGEATGMAAYEQGLRFLELSKPKRYREELGFRTYTLVRFVKRQNDGADPRKLLAPNARVLGRALADVKTSEIERAMREGQASKEQNEAARRASARLGEALRKVHVDCRMRMHAHGDLCVSVHMTAEEAIELAKLLGRLRKLEKQLQK